VELGVVARESLFIYGANLIASITGFLYWILAAKIVSSDVLGTASTIISLTNIMLALSTLGLGMAILRVGLLYRDEIGKVTSTVLALDLLATILVVLAGLAVYERVLGSLQLALLIIPLAHFLDLDEVRVDSIYNGVTSYIYFVPNILLDQILFHNLCRCKQVV